MKKLPEVNVSFKELYRMLIGSIKSKLLLTGIELKVFNHLSEPRSAEAVAKAIGTHPENTRLFLDGLVACDLLKKKEGLYQNTAVTQTFLVEGSQTYLGRMFTSMAQMFDAPINELLRLVREGPPSQRETEMGSEEMMLQLAPIYAANERAGLAQQAVEIVSGLLEFPSFKKMLDLGGGPGLVGIAIVSSHPSMRGVIFDRPAIVKAAETFIKEHGMGARRSDQRTD